MADSINNPNYEFNTVAKTNTRKCSCCGKVLPITDFDVFGKRGYHTKCKACEGKLGTEDSKLKDISSRDLINELRARGYTGELKLIRIEKVVI